jgi:hypothetical protein
MGRSAPAERSSLSRLSGSLCWLSGSDAEGCAEQTADDIDEACCAVFAPHPRHRFIVKLVTAAA